MVRDLAVTAPVLSAVPVARAHWPTTMAAAVPVWVVVYVVVAVTVTVDARRRGGLGIGLADGDRRAGHRGHRAEGRGEAAARERRPDGGRKVPPPGPGPARGAPRPPRAGCRTLPAPPPAPPREQVPDTGWLIETVVAVTGPPNGDFDEVLVVGLPTAVMHEPTVTDDSEVVVIWRMTVADV